MNKPLPSNKQIECAYIGCIFLKPDILVDSIGILQPQDFFFKPNEIIFSKLLELYKSNTPIDLTIFANSIGKSQLKNIGGITYISEIIGSEISCTNHKQYMKIIKDLSNKRQIINSCNKALENAYDDESKVEDILQDIGTEFMNVGNVEEGEKTVNAFELMESTVNLIEEGIKNGGETTGITTGYKPLDKLTNGFMKGDLVVIAGRPSCGKTALTLNIMNKLPEKSKVALFEMEMSKEKLGIRLLAPKTLIDSQSLVKGKIEDKGISLVINRANQISSKDNMFINCKAGRSIAEIRAEAKKIKIQHGLDVIFVDHIGLVRPDNPRASRNDQVGQISADLKRLAKDLDVCVVALSQLNRGVEARQDKHPMMSDLRDSGNIEQDADTILMLYRDDYYAERENRPSKKPNILEIMAAKNRDGSVGLIELMYNTQYQLITEKSYN